MEQAFTERSNKMLRIKTVGMLIVLITVAKISWLVAGYIVVAWAVLDFLLEKEDEENAKDIEAYIAAIEQVKYQKEKDARFKAFMEDDGKGR